MINTMWQSEESLIGPYAYGGPVCTFQLKTEVEDFIVIESLGFELTDEGEHIYCCIEKQNLNTEQVAVLLAEYAGISRKQINFAGLKDKVGITTQWFSVHMPGKITPDFSELDNDNLKVLSQKRHLKKLQRGVLKGNQFHIRLRDIKGDRDVLIQRLEALKSGFPNYFGLQRFGIQGQNLVKARGFLFEKRKIKSKSLKSVVLSAARSWIFNRQLAKRVQDNTWDKLIAHDLINIYGSNSVFVEDSLSPELEQRAVLREVGPAGLLWGKSNQPKFQGCYDAIRALLNEEQDWLSALEAAGLEMMPRPLVCIPEQLVYDFDDNDLLLSFFLRKGSYATSLLREL